MQMARYTAKLVTAELRSGNFNNARHPFVYRDKGSMATIGRSAAVAMVGKFKFSGFAAWMSWLCIHLIFLVGFRNKLAVLLQWFYSYIHYKRGARIITGMDKAFHIRNPKARPQSRIEKKLKTRSRRKRQKTNTEKPSKES